MHIKAQYVKYKTHSVQHSSRQEANKVIDAAPLSILSGNFPVPQRWRAECTHNGRMQSTRGGAIKTNKYLAAN